MQCLCVCIYGIVIYAVAGATSYLINSMDVLVLGLMANLNHCF